MGKLFGTDGIRGLANKHPMNATMAYEVGQAVAHMFRKDGHKAKVVIGKDTRISGYMLESALTAGICSMGGNSHLLGVLPTPGVAYMVQSSRADAGIVISASHNPYYDNGIKIFAGTGYKLPDQTEDEIEKLILDSDLDGLLPESKFMGRAYRVEDAIGRYIVFLKHSFPNELSMEGMKIVLDVGNGATYRVAPQTFWELGADVETIHNRPNGFNINDNCGSQHTQDLGNRVVETGAALGLAFDGDGDRLIAVDENGQTITGDQILIICANMLKKQNRLKNDLLVTTVMSNLGLRIACKKYGFLNHPSKVGDRYVLEDMQKMDAVIGGEESGHMIFLEHHTTGDGILSALQLVAAMVLEGKPLSELAGMMDIFPQMLINLEVSQKPDIDTVPAIRDAIDEVEKELGEEGRVLVRYSGTQNLCRVMVEGPTDELTRKHCEQIAKVVKDNIG